MGLGPFNSLLVLYCILTAAVILPRHVEGKKMDRTVWILSTFHAYVSYHVKVRFLCSYISVVSLITLFNQISTYASWEFYNCDIEGEVLTFGLVCYTNHFILLEAKKIIMVVQCYRLREFRRIRPRPEKHDENAWKAVILSI